MNLIGQIGNFIAVYHQGIAITLTVVIAVIIVIALVRTVYNIEKNRRNLDELKETVSEISAKVNRISLKEELKQEIKNTESKERREIIYIDNRAAAPEDCDTPDMSSAEAFLYDKDTEEHETKCEAEGDKAGEGWNGAKAASAEGPEETIPEVKKYFSRNDFISKNGKKYSKEELEKQIR